MSRSRNNKNKKTNQLRLVGWLVSYAMDELGKAFEIRSGRTLISSGSEEQNRMILLAQEGISAPHMAMKASPNAQVMVQDIFSEKGTFLKKAGAKEEKKVAGPVELGHGDWLRIGSDVRFQVCLINGTSR